MNNPLCEAKVQPESESAWEAWEIKLVKDKQALLKLCYFHFIFALPPIVVAVAGGWNQSCHRGCVDVAWIMPSKISCWTFHLTCIKCSMSLGPHLKLSWTKNWRRKNGIDFHGTNICYFRICDASLCLQNRFFSQYILMIWSCQTMYAREWSLLLKTLPLSWIFHCPSKTMFKLDLVLSELKRAEGEALKIQTLKFFSTIGLGTDSDWKLRPWRWSFLHCSITLVDFHHHSPTSVSSADQQR